jgi:hypothetical protein
LGEAAQIDDVANVGAWVLSDEAAVVSWVPISSCHYVLEALRDPIGNGNRFIPRGHGKCAAWHEVVL